MTEVKEVIKLNKNLGEKMSRDMKFQLQNTLQICNRVYNNKLCNTYALSTFYENAVNKIILGK